MTGRRPARARGHLAVVPLILVNLVAITGQLAFLRDHLSWGLPGDLVFAAALESIAVYLAYHAHIALVSNDSALRLRLASYTFGAVIGACNYSHYAPRWHPTFQAIAVGLMSASSPWLWAIHSRRQSRAALLEAGLIEPHALRLGPTRWLWHPLRSARVMFQATWDGTTDPHEAVTVWETHRGGTHLPGAPVAASGTHQAGASQTPPGAAIGTHPPAALPAGNGRAPETHRRRGRKSVSDAAAETHFATYLAGGQVPSVRRIERELHVGRPRAQEIRRHLARQAFST